MISLSGAFATEEEPRSREISKIFEEEPVGLQTFISDKKFLGADWMLSPLQLQLVQIVERVYLPDMYPLLAEEFGGYWAGVQDLPMKHIVNAEWGKGGGKDSTIRVAALRVAYLMMCLKSPQKYFSMPEDDSIHILNIAVNAPQAHRAFFEPMTRMVKRGWFADRAEPHRDTITYAKNITAISGHSDAESQEGLNIMLGVADEIDAFKAKGEMVGQGNKAREASTSAESILDMLKTSASTRFPDSYKRVAISYPRFLGSTIQQLTAEAKADIEMYGDADSDYFASGPYATWEVNPTKSKEQYAKDYRKDPKAAQAKYECKPSRAVDAYFKNPEIFKFAVDREVQPLHISYVLQTRRSPNGVVTQGWEPKYNFAPDFLPIQGAHYAMHGDLAIKGDRAGIAMSHVQKWQTRTVTVTDEDGTEFEKEEVVPIIKVDFVVAFTADVSALDAEGSSRPREIQIRWAKELAVELINRGFYIQRFTFDQFQSSETMQALERMGIETERVSADIVTTNVWKNLKDVASDGRLHMPFDLLLMNELEALSTVNGKVDHPPFGSKDMADALACSIVGAMVCGGEEDADGRSTEIGLPFFETGSAVSDLAGYDEIEESMGSPLGMPIGMFGFGGMKGMGF